MCKTIKQKVRFNAAPRAVYDLLASDAGRARFWAEEALERGGAIDFVFPGANIGVARSSPVSPAVASVWPTTAAVLPPSPSPTTARATLT